MDSLGDDARKWVKGHYREIVDRYVAGIEAQIDLVSIFMAGSPGAGKTEFSKRLLSRIPESGKLIVRIDPDEVRGLIPQYRPGRAHEIQGAVALAVEKLHDHVLRNNYSFLLDGTFSNYEKSRSNVERSLKYGRAVSIQYVVQPPQIAWRFTQDREKVEGRNIPRGIFIEQYIASRKTVDILKKEFGDKIVVDLIERDISKRGDDYRVRFNISDIDIYLDNKYSRKDLDDII